MAVNGWSRVLALTLVTGLMGAGFAYAQAPPQVKQTTAPRTSPGSGEEMFKTYCTACHGPNGKGDGPAAPALKVKPADLTALASKNGGKFPASDVERVLRFGITLPAHGSSDMPTWGDAFRMMGDEGTVRLRIANLTTYIQGLQGK